MNNPEPFATPTLTGKHRVVQDQYDFKFYIEQEFSGGQWQRNHAFPAFSTVTDAHAHFQRTKKIRKSLPADLGNIDDV